MTEKASDPINASAPKAYANLRVQKTDSLQISGRKEALKMEKSSRSRNNRIQKTNGTVTVDALQEAFELLIQLRANRRRF